MNTKNIQYLKSLWISLAHLKSSVVNDLPSPKSDTISTGSYLDGYVALKQLPLSYTGIADKTSLSNAKGCCSFLAQNTAHCRKGTACKAWLKLNVERALGYASIVDMLSGTECVHWEFKLIRVQLITILLDKLFRFPFFFKALFVGWTEYRVHFTYIVFILIVFILICLDLNMILKRRISFEYSASMLSHNLPCTLRSAWLKLFRPFC